MKQENQEIQLHPNAQTPSIFGSIQALKDAQVIAKPLIESDIVPDKYRGNMANALVALDIAQRLGAPPLVIMQNLDIIQGRPSFSGKFLIAALRNMPKFKNIRPVYFGTKGQNNRGCKYVAVDTITGETIEGPEATVEMAKAEGWYQKKGSKWQTMPELMLAYRAGSFFSRIYAPEITMGLPTSEEAYDAPRTEDVEYSEVEEINKTMQKQPKSEPEMKAAEKPKEQQPEEKPKVGYSFNDDEEVVPD